MGIRTPRKSNPISEMFSSYRPSDYKGLIDEFLAAEQAGKVAARGYEAPAPSSSWLESLVFVIILVSVSVLYFVLSKN